MTTRRSLEDLQRRASVGLSSASSDGNSAIATLRARQGGAFSGFEDPTQPTDSAAALERLDRNRTSAVGLINSAMVSGSDLKRVQEIADQGHGGGVFRGLANIFEFIDRPRRASGLFIRDVLQVDKARAGKEIGVSDYWKVITGDKEGLIDSLGEDLVGEYADLSFANLLDDVYKLDEDAGFWEKAGRGLVSFAGDVATDPLSFVSLGLSGAGRNVAGTAVRNGVEDAGKVAARGLLRTPSRRAIVKSTDVAQEALTPLEAQLRREIAEKAERELTGELSRLSDDLGRAVTKDEADELFDQLVFKNAGIADDGSVFTGGIISDYGNDILTAVLSKDFAGRTLNLQQKGRWDMFLAHAGRKRDGRLVFADQWATGGIRFAPKTAFSLKQSRPIGRGSGGWIKSKTFGPVVQRVRDTKAGDWVADLFEHTSKNRRLYTMGRNGEAYNYWALEDVAKRVPQQIDAPGNMAILANTTRELYQVARRAGMDEDASVDLLRQATRSMATGAPASEVLAASNVPQGVKEAFNDYVTHATEMVGETFATLQRHVPIEKLENYVPIVVDADFSRAVRRMDVQGQLPSADPDALARWGIDPADWATFQEVLGHVTPSGERTLRPIGSSRFFGNRTIGKELFRTDNAGTLLVNRIGDSNVVSVAGRQFQSPNDLNEALMRVSRALGITDKIENALELDPLKAFGRYMADVQTAAQEAAMFAEARRLGLIERGTFAYAVDHFIYDAQPIYEAAEKAAKGVINEGEKYVRKLQLQDVPMRTVRVGGVDVDIPEAVVNRPVVQRAVQRARDQMRTVKANENAQRKAVRLRSRQLQQDLRISEEAANVMAAIEAPETLFEVQTLARQALADLADEVEGAVQRGMDYHAEGLQRLRTNRSVARRVAKRMQRQGNQRLDEWTRKYNEQFGLRPQAREVSFTVYADDGSIDMEATGKVLGELLGIARARLRSNVEKSFEGLREEFEELTERMVQRGLDPNLPIEAVPVQDRPIYARLHRLQSAANLREAVLQSSDRQNFYLNALADVERTASIEALERQQEYVDLLNHIYVRLEEATDPDRVLREWDVTGEEVEEVREMLGTWLDYAGEEALYHPIAEHPTVLKVLAADGGTSDTLLGRVLHSRSKLNVLRQNVEEPGRLVGGLPENPMRMLAALQAGNDPEAMQIAAQNVDALERLLRNVLQDQDGNLVLRPRGRGQWHIGWARSDEVAAAAPPLDDVRQALLEGTDEALEGIPQEAVELVRQIESVSQVVATARRAAVTARRRSTAEAKRFDEIERTWTNFSKHIYGALTGRPGDVKRLRADVLIRRPDGSAKATKGWRDLLDMVPDHVAARLQNMVDNAFMLDEDVMGVTRSWMQQNAALYDGVLYRPFEQSLAKLREVTGRMYTQHADREIAEVSKRTEMAEAFLENVRMMRELSLTDRPVGGTRSSTYLQDFKSLKDDIGRSAKALDDKSHIFNLYEDDAAGKVTSGAVRRAQNQAAEAAKQRQTREGFVPGGRFGSTSLEGFDVDPHVGAIFEDMLRSYRVIHTPWGIEQMSRIGRDMMSWWRSAVTVTKPDFHVRNLIGGIANGLLAGVGPRSYVRVMRNLHTFRDLMRRVGTEDGLRTMEDVFKRLGNDADLYRAAWGEGVLQAGFARADITSKNVVPGGRRSLKPWKADNALFSAGGNMMERFEDLMRLAAFEAWYDPARPATARLARDMTMLVHFDYQHLTQLEERIKKVAPFFVWTRNNVPLQIKQLMERPGVINAYNSAVRNARESRDSELPADYFPLDRWSSSLAIPTSFAFNEDTPFWSRVVFDPDLPVLALDELPLFNEGPFTTEWFNWATELLGPHVSFPFQFGELAEMPDTVAPRGLNEIFAAVDEVLPLGRTTASGDFMVPASARAAFDAAVPFYDSYRRLIGMTPTSKNKVGAEGFAGVEADPSFAPFAAPPNNRHLKGVLNSIGRGLFGFTFQSPQDTPATAFDASEFLREVKQKGDLGLYDS